MSIKIGIIGCGKIAQVRHIPEYAANPEAKLTAFFDADAQRTAEIAAKYGGRACASVQELLDDPAIDGVSVCVANHAHAELAIAALRAGNDMVVTPDFEKQIPLVLAALEDGTLDMEAIDAALRRVLGWKYDLGLLDAAP